MATYTIGTRDSDGTPRAEWTVTAESVEDAARIHLGTGPGRVRGAWPERITGTHGKSGWFRPFRRCKGSGTFSATSCGRDFHVM